MTDREHQPDDDDTPPPVIHLPEQRLDDYQDGAIYAGPTGRLWRCVRSGDAVDFRPVLVNELLPAD